MKSTSRSVISEVGLVAITILCGFSFSVRIAAIRILAEKFDPILRSITQFIFTAMTALLVALIYRTLSNTLGSQLNLFSCLCWSIPPARGNTIRL